MNNKGQTIVTLLYILIAGVLIWALALSTQLSYWGNQAALQTTGIEALLWDNLNLWVFIGFVLFTVVGGYVVSNQ